MVQIEQWKITCSNVPCYRWDHFTITSLVSKNPRRLLGSQKLRNEGRNLCNKLASNKNNQSRNKDSLQTGLEQNDPVYIPKDYPFLWQQQQLPLDFSYLIHDGNSGIFNHRVLVGQWRIVFYPEMHQKIWIQFWKDILPLRLIKYFRQQDKDSLSYRKQETVIT